MCNPFSKLGLLGIFLIYVRRIHVSCHASKSIYVTFRNSF